MAEEKKRAINRLKSVIPLRIKVDETYKTTMEAMHEGKPTGWSMVTWWLADPIMKAMDLNVVYPENYGTICAASGAAEEHVERSYAEGFPTHLCGYATNCLGYTAKMMKDYGGEIPPDAPMGGMSKPAFMVSVGSACDARFKWYESLGRYLDVPQFNLDLPHPGAKEMLGGGMYPDVIKFIVVKLREFVEFLEKLLHKKMDWDRLDEVVHLHEQILRVWYDINELRRARPCPMHTRDFYSAMSPAYLLLGDLEDNLNCYKNLYDEVKQRVENGIGAVENEKYRMVFAELPPWHSLGFFDRLAERGWNFVKESRGYHPPAPIDMTSVKDPLERVAMISFKHQSEFFETTLKENEPFFNVYAYLLWARTYQCDGAFLHPVRTCRMATYFLPYIQDMLMQRLKVPSLLVEGDIVDLRLFNPADALKRAEAFEEIMDYYKEQRKKEGFGW